MDPNTQYERVEAVVRSVEAPAALRERIAAERDRTLIRRMVVKRMKLTGALAGAAAVLGIVVGLASLRSEPDPSRPSEPAVPTSPPVTAQRPSPSLQAARFASLPPEGAAPKTDRSHPRLLEAKVDNVTFPAWANRFAWKARGQRSDELDGREVLTVFYENPGGVRLGYTIVGDGALPWPGNARRVVRNGVDIRIVRRQGRVLAFWRVEEQTCIISAPDTMPVEQVVALAAYDAYA